jgi:hypothetical protein
MDPLPFPDDPRASALAEDLAYEIVRAFAGVAALMADHPPAATPALVAEALCDRVAERLHVYAHVFDPDDLQTAVLLVGEAIDTLGGGDRLVAEAVPAFRARATT